MFKLILSKCDVCYMIYGWLMVILTYFDEVLQINIRNNSLTYRDGIKKKKKTLIIHID